MLKRVILFLILIFLPNSVLAVTPPLAAPLRDEEIREAITTFVRQKTANSGWDVRIKKLSLPGIVQFPAGQAEYEIQAPQQWEGWGVVSLTVLVRQNGTVVRNIPVRIEVEALAEMVVTTRQIENGTVLSDADLKLQRRDIWTVGGKFVGSITDISGRRSKGTLQSNVPVRSDQVEKVPLVKTGQLVTIVAESSVLKITVAGKVKSTGAAGDMVMVQNLNSLKEMPARVINATTVQVNF